MPSCIHAVGIDSEGFGEQLSNKGGIMQFSKTFRLFQAFVVLAGSGLAAAEPQTIRIGVIGPLSVKSSEDMGLSIIGGAKVF